MLFANQKTVFNHDYFKIINSVYPKIRKNIEKIIQSFEESRDASKYFVEYFSEGHSEIHSILGAGATSGGSMDVSNLLKPALAKGEIRCIGSTTYEEYKKIFE